MKTKISSRKPEKSLFQQRLDIFYPTLVKLKATKDREHKKDKDKPYFSINPWELDKAKIDACDATKRLSGKMQVCAAIYQPYPLTPLNPHISNRASHTRDVESAATIASCILNLNVPATGAIVKVHDIGTPPFAHNGQRALKLTGGHGLNGANIAQKVERGGHGLNLTYEVVEGAIEHSQNNLNIATARIPNETKVVIIADEIAYTAADRDDLKNLIMNYKNGANGGKNNGVTGITELLDNGLDKNLPEELDELGKNKRQVILSCINALVRESLEKNCVSFSESATAQKLRAFRELMYKEVYHKLDQTEERIKHREYLEIIVEYIDANGLSGSIDSRFATSFFTDQEALWLAELISDHNPNEEDRQQIETLSFREIIRSLPKNIEINHLKSPLWKI
ncbi:HD domain-containing protein [Patescibacteria group bacterium]|nr:HD domain-containing protein [Patescibacteria group bacterium]MBU4580099.1 HD domain-containing protein [Patescibacteria group bacterium]